MVYSDFLERLLREMRLRRARYNGVVGRRCSKYGRNSFGSQPRIRRGRAHLRGLDGMRRREKYANPGMSRESVPVDRKFADTADPHTTYTALSVRSAYSDLRDIIALRNRWRASKSGGIRSQFART